MPTVEFTAPDGKTFTAQEYNATTGAAIGVTVAVTEAAKGLYRFTAASAAGVSYFVATATNVIVTGFADLSNPAANTHCPLKDTYDEAAASQVATLSEINKIPRADAAIAAGAAVQRTLDDAFTDYIQEKIRKVP